MKVIVLGAGQVGVSIANYLSRDDHDITIVDESDSVLKSVEDDPNIRTIKGFASRPSTIEQAGGEFADAIIAVTGSDEVNMVACEIAHSLFKVPLKIARIRDQDYMDRNWSGIFSSRSFPIDVIISPEVEVANVIYRSIQIEGAFFVYPLVGGKLKLVGVRVSGQVSVANTPLRLLGGIVDAPDIVVVFIKRKDGYFIPGDNDFIALDDEVYFIVSTESAVDAMKAFRAGTNPNKNIVIMGGGNIGHMVAKRLEAQDNSVSVKIIEQDKARAEYISSQLHEAIVLLGDILDTDLLTECNIDRTDTVVTVTHDDKVNILGSLLAKKHGAHHVMALLNNMSYGPLVTSLGVDALINPRQITISSILQHIRKSNLVSTIALGDDVGVEIIEAVVHETSPIVGMTVEDISIKKNLMVALLIRDDAINFVPHKKTFICVDDHVVMVAAKDNVHKVEKLFSKRIAG